MNRKLLAPVMLAMILFSTCAKVNVFTEPPDYPVIDSIAPASGRIGTQIRLYGTGYSIYPSQNSVSVNGVPVRVDSPSISTVVLATITSVTGTGHTKLKVGGKEADGPIFTYDANAISINSLSPASGWVDTTVTLRGVGFGTVKDSAKVNFNGHPATIKYFSDTLIIVSAPDATNQVPGTVTVTVTIGGRVSNGLPFTYGSQAKPVITKAAQGWYDGSGYSLTVTNLPLTDNSIQLFVNGAQVKFDHVSRANGDFYDDGAGDQALVIIHDSTIVNHLVLNYADYKVVCNGIASDVFRFVVRPRITDVEPQIATAGDTMTISGLYFGDRSFPSRLTFSQSVYDTLTDPPIISWKNTEIKIKMPFYSNLKPLGADPTRAQISTQVNVADKQSYATYFYCKITTDPGTLVHSGGGNFSPARYSLAAAGTGNKIAFGGGDGPVTNVVNIYDIVAGTWATSQLSQARAWLAAAAAGNKIVFAGGENNDVVSNAVDIYDVSTGVWTTAHLSEARHSLTAAAAGNKIIFAGGFGTTGFSTTVDIYDVSTGAWTTAHLSEGRYYGLAAASAGNKILIAGGHSSVSNVSGTVDIYDVSTGAWTTAQLSEARANLAAAGAGNKIVFGGGFGTNYSKTVDIYDVTTGTWTTSQLSLARQALAATAVGNKLIFGGGLTGNATGSSSSNMVDVYDVVTGVWTTMELGVGRTALAAASAGKTAIFGGGAVSQSFGSSGTSTPSGAVDIFTLQ